MLKIGNFSLFVDNCEVFNTRQEWIDCHPRSERKISTGTNSQS